MKRMMTLLLSCLLTVLPALAEGPVNIGAMMEEMEAQAKSLSVGGLTFSLSEDRQSIYIDRPASRGAAITPLPTIYTMPIPTRSTISIPTRRGWLPRRDMAACSMCLWW